jgi:hypothetical protein
MNRPNTLRPTPLAATLALLASAAGASATDYSWQAAYGDTDMWNNNFGWVYRVATADALSNSTPTMKTTDSLTLNACWFVTDDTKLSGAAHRFRMEVFDNGVLKCPAVTWAKDTGAWETGFWSKLQSTPKLTFAAGVHVITVKVKVVIDSGGGNRDEEVDTFQFVVNVT